MLGGVAVFLQDSAETQHDIHLLMIYVGIIAIVMLALVAVILIGGLVAGLFAMKLVKRAEAAGEKAERRIVPLLDMVEGLAQDLTPKIKSIAENTEQISYSVRGKVDELSVTLGELNETVREINQRTRVQVTRVDGIVTDAVTATEEISQTVQNGIKVPIRQIAGVIAGLRAGLDTLIARSPFNRGSSQAERTYRASEPGYSRDVPPSPPLDL
jgi:methyl-accepting chemotaxis protein